MSKSASDKPLEQTGADHVNGRSSPIRSDLVELSREECLELLAEHGIGRLAVGTRRGAPAIRPVNYRFDEASQSVVFRTARGSKLQALLSAGEAAFEIDGVEERSRRGWSVVIHGVAEEVTRPAEVRRLEGLGLEPWAPGPKPHWVRIRARTVSGRRLVPPDRTAAL